MARATSLETKHESKYLVIWSGAALAGFLAGLAFGVWQILLTWWVFGQAPWATVRLIASVALGEEVTRVPLSWDFVIVHTGILVHAALSILFAILIAPLIARLQMGAAVAAGIVFGALLYVVNFYVFAPAVFAWMEEMRHWVTFLGHLLFGLVVAFVYKLAQSAQRKSLEVPASRTGA